MHALAALVLLSTAPAPAPVPSEMRGLWVVRTGLVSPESVDRTVEEAARGGFNALFVQVRGRGDALYRSALVPRSPLLSDPTFDPLARLLERARARGLQVHAWVNVLLAAAHGRPLPGGHVLAGHPEWAMVSRSQARAGLPSAELGPPGAFAALAGEAEGLYLSPSAPGVGAHLEAVVRELLRGYSVDGLHLDFIRYPGPDYDYAPAALEGFARWRGPSGELAALPQRDPGGWSEYRRETLSALAARLASSARAERPGLVISAAVVPDEAQAVHHKYQDWPAWLARGILDAVCPMAYTTDARIFRWQVAGALRRAQRGQSVWAGVAAYRLSLAAVVGHVRAARASGAGGVILFSHESLAAGDADWLRREAFPSPAGPRPAGAAASGGTSHR